MMRGRHPGGRPPPEDPDRPRLFFAVPLPDEVREGIRPIRDAVQAGVGDGHARIRWVRIESLHLTLRFLGPTPLDQAPALERAAAQAARGVAPFGVTIGGAGAFPDDGRPRTLWLGLRAGAEGLAGLVEALDRALPPGGHDERSHADGEDGGNASAGGHGDGEAWRVGSEAAYRDASAAPHDGVRSGARPFTPHLTIARTDGLRFAGEAARALAAAASGHEWSFLADRIVLFRSHLGNGPAWYEPLAQVPLG